MEGDKNGFSGPVPDGEQNARKLVRNINKACRLFPQEFIEAVESRSQGAILRANNTRSLLESDLKELRVVTGVGDAFLPKVTKAIEQAVKVLSDHDPILDIPEDNTAPPPVASSDSFEQTHRQPTPVPTDFSLSYQP